MIRTVLLGVIVPILLAWSLSHLIPFSPDTLDHRKRGLRDKTFGPVKLTLKLPGTERGIPEPILTCGRTGNAALVYLRLIKPSKARICVEYWGVGAFESEDFPLSSPGAAIAVTCILPSFYPQRGDSFWDNLSPALREKRLTEYVFLVDGIVRLKGKITYSLEANFPVYIGLNPLGGSLVSPQFTGTVLAAPQSE